MKTIRKYGWMVIVIVALVSLPLVMFQYAQFTGTDDKAVSMVQGIDKNYKPWFEGVKLFDSPEIISTFFALQAAIGASVLGYYIGFSRGKQQNKKA